MSIQRLTTFLVAVAVSGIALAQGSVQVRTTRPNANATIEKEFGGGKVLVSVRDANRAEVMGLGVRDFTVGRGSESAEVVTVEPIERSTEATRHVVFVLDNSYSLQERGAISKLLTAAGPFLKAIRPIDDAHIVVLKDGKPTKMGDRDVHVEVLHSKSPDELQAFATNAYGKKRVTDNTYLYEAIYAGLSILKGTPANDNRVLMIFSDGEDLNSGFKGDVVSQAAKEVPDLHVLAVDCMPGPKMDDFMGSFASQNMGQARKAGSAGDLMAAFEKLATKLEHFYVVTYAFAPPAVAGAPPPAPSPKRVAFNQAALFDFDKAELKPAGKEQLKEYYAKTKEELSSAQTVKISGHTDNVGTHEYNMKLSKRRAQAVRDYLISIGADASKMEVDGEGETQPVADNSTKEGRAKNRRVEIEVSGLSH